MAETKLSGQATNIIRRNTNGSSIAIADKQVIVMGHGYITGDGTSQIQEDVSFGVTFANIPIVMGSSAGYYATGGGDRYNTTTLLRFQGYIANPQCPTTTQFTSALIRVDGSTFQNTNDFYYTWIAIGELA